MFWPLAGSPYPHLSPVLFVYGKPLDTEVSKWEGVSSRGTSGSGFFLSQQIEETNPRENADQREPRDVKVFDCMGHYVCCLVSGSQLLLQSGSGQW